MDEDRGKVVRHEVELFSEYDVTDRSYVVNEIGRPIGQVFRDIEKQIPRDILMEFDSYGVHCYPMKPTDPFPTYHWLAIYYVTGGSEGYWVHIDLINGDNERTLIWLAKTLHEGEGPAWCEKLVHELCRIMKP